MQTELKINGEQVEIYWEFHPGRMMDTHVWYYWQVCKGWDENGNQYRGFAKFSGPDLMEIRNVEIVETA